MIETARRMAARLKEYSAESNGHGIGGSGDDGSGVSPGLSTVLSLSEHPDVLIVTHIDADGITAGSIASIALTRAGIGHNMEFLKQLDEAKIEALKEKQREGKIGLVWFTDFGSGLINRMGGLEAIISDHHIPAQVLPPREKRGDITAFIGLGSDAPVNVEGIIHLNPHLFGGNGADDISGAGVTYMIARAMDESNMDLAALAVVGAVGDLQDSAHGKLIETNRHIIEDGEKVGVLEAMIDIRSFGRETRPVFKLLQYTNDPILPGLTGDYEACLEFMVECGVKPRVDWEENGSERDPVHNGGSDRRGRCWTDLSGDERKNILSGLVKHCLSNGLGAKATRRLIGEVYALSRENHHEPLRDAKEFATMLNSCGRYGKAEIGYRVCLGDREEWYDRAKIMLQNHRRVLVDMIKYVEREGVTPLENIQYFDGGDYIPENIVGIVAGMVLGSGNLETRLPILGLANAEEGMVKVSARTVRRMVDKGVNLSEALHEIAGALGGAGGGHNIAAGAHIPEGKKEEFLGLMDGFIGRQLEDQ